jgi:NTE family protein
MTSAKKVLNRETATHISHTTASKKNRKIIYVFQGGGALGSFQVGGVEALYEHDYRADMVVGISIGGMNAAIVAGNPPEKRLEKLKQFWNKITVSIPLPNSPFAGMSKIHNYFGAQHALHLGQSGFYKPKLLSPWLLSHVTPDQLSFYDTSPLRETLNEVIDFEYLNQGHVRLCLGATELASGDFVFFDNSKEKITVEHIMASGALPPGFPAIEIDGRYYVDGGVYANTPLSKVLEEFADTEHDICNVLCFMFDLFSASGPLPHTMDGMLERIKDIQYSSHSKRSNAIYSTAQNLSHAIKFLGSKLPAEVKHDPDVKAVLKLGNAHRLDLVHVIYRSRKGTELNSKDYNFSAESAHLHYQQGYEITHKLIESKQHEWSKQHSDGMTIYTINEDKPTTINI